MSDIITSTQVGTTCPVVTTTFVDTNIGNTTWTEVTNETCSPWTSGCNETDWMRWIEDTVRNVLKSNKPSNNDQ